MRFDGKAVLITGGAGGVGSAAAAAFAERGGRVVIVDRDLAATEQTASAIRQKGFDCLAIQADVSNEEDVARYVSETVASLGSIDCFFSNAGIYGKTQPITSTVLADFDAVFAVNVKGVLLGMKYVLPVMQRAGQGTIVNMSSVSAFLASPGIAAYAASKAAVIALTVVAAAESASHNIRVNAICPGSIPTGMLETAKKASGVVDSQAADVRYQSAIPTGRYSTAVEVANLAMFLCSDLSGNITGQHHVIDGGRTVVSNVIHPAK